MPSVVFRAGAARFELDPTRRALLRDGVAVPLGARALDLLLALSARPGQLMRRSELLDLVWPDDAVEENNLAVQVNALRKAIGRELVVTVPGRGYVLAAPLAAVPTERAEPVPAGAPAPLFGRDADLRALVAMLGRHRLSTLVGAGGAGKTRLAQAALHALHPAPAHGVGFVDLTPLQDAGALPGAVAAALGLSLRGADAVAALVLALAPLQLVLVLDNAEHLVDGVAALVATLLAGAPRLACLVTSQLPLQLAEEQLHRLDGLDLPPLQAAPAEAMASGAVALFVARVQALDRRFVLDAANVAHVVAICRSLDGLPLALELAAARLPLLGAAALRSALEQRLQVLTQGWRGAPPRQQSLRAALAWSHGLLNAAERTVFRRLAVFAGSGSLPMLQQVLCDTPGTGLDGWDVLEALDGLVHRSLLRVLPDAPGAEPRYALLESPLALAREQLAASGEAALLAQRHAAAVAGLFAEAEERLWRGDAGFMARPVDELLAADIGNGSAALAWALQHDVTLALRIGVTLSRVLGANRYRERIALCRRIEPLLDTTLSPPVPPAVLGYAALQCAEALHQTAAASASHARRARAWLAEAGVQRGCYVALCVEARAQARLGATELLPPLMAELDTLEDPGWPPAVVLMGAAVRSHWCALQHDRDGERRWMYRCAALLRDAGRSDTAPMVNLVGIEYRAGCHAEAVALGEQIVQRLQGTRQQLELAHTWVNLCMAQIAAGRLDAARQSARAAWPMVRQFDLHPNWADNAALLAVQEGRAADALKLLGYAEHAYAQLGTQRDELGRADLARAEQAAATLLAAAGATQTPTRLKAEGQALTDAALAQLA